MTGRDEVYAAIDREREHQRRKWGTLENKGHTVGEWLLVIEGELAEAKKAWTDAKGDEECLREIVQVAASAVACMEQHRPVGR